MEQTIPTVLKEVRNAGRNISRRQLYRYFDVLGIEALGARQRPQHYPADTSHRILAHLGLSETTTNKIKAPGTEKGRIYSLREIKAKARKGGRK